MNLQINTLIFGYTDVYGGLIYAFIKHHCEHNPYGCRYTMKEMCHILNLSDSTVSKKTKQLTNQGILKFDLSYRKWEILPEEGWTKSNNQKNAA